MATTTRTWAPSFSRVHSLEVIDIDIPRLPESGVTLEYSCFYYTYTLHYSSKCCLALSFFDAGIITSAITSKSPYLQ